ncbi:MAG: RNA-guided endonuclease InsQ/TnpB family protein [Xenococcaceae cyanobacterium]
MRQVEKHLIKTNHKYYQEIKRLCFLSKNLYNATLYLLRQHFFSDSKLISYNQTYHRIKNSSDYKALPAKVSQPIIKQVCTNFESWFKASREYYQNPNKFKAKPKIPKYKHKVTGANKLTYNYQAVSKSFLKKGLVKLSQTNLVFKTKQSKLAEVRLIPKNNGSYFLEVVYSVEEKPVLINNNRIAAVDLGLNNLATVATNCLDVKPIIINGRQIKSTNRWFNKRKAFLTSLLPKKRTSHAFEQSSNVVSSTFTSHRLNRLSVKRNSKIDYYLHKASRQIINYLVDNKISHLIIGKNENWKQNLNIGKKNNQSFTNVPHAKLIEMLTYKGQFEGIAVTITEESYTSKTSFLDGEEPIKQEVYLGKRIKRGLFSSSKEIKINADLNGALQIMKKVVGNSVFNSDSILRYVVYPKVVNVNSL